MKKIVSLLLLLGASTVSATTYRFSDKNGRRQITFESATPVENFDGNAEEFSGMMSANFSRPQLDLTAEITIPVPSMTTGLSMRDEHMRSPDWLSAIRYPTIRFYLASSGEQKVKPKGKNQWFVQAIGNFSLKGTTERITVPVTIQRNGSKVVVSGRFKIKLSDYGIRGPAAMRMIGFRVGEEVLVSFKLVGVGR